MSVLVIRAHKRFAVRGRAKLGKQGRRASEGLVIELSLDGCRIGGLISANYEIGDDTTLRIDGWEPLPCRVRWTGAGVVGLRFATPLHTDALDRLIRHCRDADTLPPACAAG